MKIPQKRIVGALFSLWLVALLVVFGQFTPAQAQAPKIAMRVRVLDVDGVAPAADATWKLGMEASPKIVEFKGGDWSEWVESVPEKMAEVRAVYPNSLMSEAMLLIKCALNTSGKAIHLEAESAIEGGEKSK